MNQLDFYESLRTEADLDRLVRDRRQADLHLDFKEQARNDVCSRADSPLV
jgi:hypothetical protein